MSSQFALNIFLPAMAFAVGACIGSFLNVVIYRVPAGLSVNEPRRSFCFACNKQIPIWLNLPLISWLWLRGKCRDCGSVIAFRYFAVELLTGVLFFLIWRQVLDAGFGLGVVLALWVLVALLVAATFIDIDHLIIPDSITIGGTVVGLIFSLLFPALHSEFVWWRGGLQGLIGAMLGFSLLWLIVLMGKAMYGRIRHEFEEPVPFEVSQPGGDEAPIVIQLGEHEYEWGEVFFRQWDRLVMEVTELRFDGEERVVEESFVGVPDGFELDGKKVPLESVKRVTGFLTKATVPREAMGFGDVKFIAMIGAFLGWQAILVTIFAASFIGAVIGLTQRFMSRGEGSKPMPFGPYLAMGALVWIFGGSGLIDWYLTVLQR